MGTKENIQYIKEELSSEEKFLEGFVKVERFYKKYKNIIIAAAAIVIIAVIGSMVSSYMDQQNKAAANAAFTKILQNPSDQEALATLKDKNEELYEIAKYLNAKKEGKIVEINVEFLKELALYEKAIKSSDIAALSSLSLNDKFLLKENALFNKALLETKNGNYKAAKESLSQIPNDSKINNMVSLLKHFLASK